MTAGRGAAIPEDGVAGFAIDLVEALGGLGAAIAVFLENLFPPIPSEVVLPLAGFAASDGVLTLGAAMAWTTAGSVAGAIVLYGIGAGLGRRRTTALMTRLPLVELADVHRAEAWFADHGRAAIFFGRMVPGVRSLVSIPAGVDRMPLAQFTAYTTAGSAIWNAVLIGAGYALGARWSVVEPYVGTASDLVLLAVAGLATWWAVRRLAARRRRRD